MRDKQRQIGNAVPVTLAKVLGLAIKDALQQSFSSIEMNSFEEWFERLIYHPKKSELTLLEKDFLNSVFCKVKKKSTNSG